MEKQYAKDFLKKYLTVIGGPAAVDALDDENKADKAKEFVKKYFTMVGGPEAIDAAAEPEGNYLTMTLPEGSSTTQISINKEGEPVGTNFQYRVNNGNWNVWDFATSQPISAVANDVIQWKGNNPGGLSKDDENYIYFEFSNEVNLSGNVMSLIDGIGYTKVIPCDYCFNSLFCDATNVKAVTKDFLPATILTVGCYSDMFAWCESLLNAPALPATTLSSYCYSSMFKGCTSLVKAPELPAETLAEGCYFEMFNMCSSLENAPELPATTLAPYCYARMFWDCSKLVTAPELPATTLADYCYSTMFSSCNSIVNAPELPATTLARGCYESMFNWCFSLENAPELPATTLARGCYSLMFNVCSSLVNAPELPATTLAEGCYKSMFSGCSNLNKVTCFATDKSATDCTTNWLSNVASKGTFNKAAGVTWSTGVNGIPNGWTVKELGQPTGDTSAR